jgi:outer membrane protein assembly factor BamA
VPAFDGKAPAKSQVLDTIGTGLARLLKSRGIPGQIDYQPSIKLGSGGSRGHVFSVVSPSPRLCSLNFEGASVVSEADLRTAASDAIGQPYSKSFMADFANKTLVQPYQKRGHWKAAFAPPVVKAGAAGDCAGAIVSIKVDEGAGYRWSRTLWEGNTAVQANRLDKLLVVTPDAIADGTIVPAGLRAIEDEYRRFGYMQQTSNQGLVFDDEAKRVALRITIREGAVFRMGNFVADGLPQNIEDALRKKWKLKSGEVFDASYFTDFLRKELAPYSTPARPLVLQYRVNSSAQTVDVVVAPKK